MGQDVYLFDEFEVRVEERVLLHVGDAAEIGARAFDVLAVLLENYGTVVARETLLERVWPGLVVEENNLSVQISSLRKILGHSAITTVPGRGYQFSLSLNDDATDAESSEAMVPLSSEIENEPSYRTNLPARLPKMYGRGAEVGELTHLIEVAQLVTIVGPAGIGKTSIAQMLAADQRTRFSDGVWLIELASLNDSSLVAQTIARALQISLPGSDSPTRELVSALRGRRALLVLDNCEHLIEGVRAIAAEILQGAKDIVLVATSQTRLRIPFERAYELGPLSLPAVDSSTESGAVRLFSVRAQAFDAKFALSIENLPDVQTICRQLEGIPLAIELAAARVHVYGLKGVLNRLREDFSVLSQGALLNPRHSTLQAALTWSHDLLSATEQTVFRRLGVFVGGFSFDGAKAVVSDDSIDENAAIEHLTSLIDKSLVSVVQGSFPRYRLLETTRAFALDKLAAASETDAVTQRYALQTLSLIRMLARTRKTELLFEEMSNVRAAYSWAMASGKNNATAIGLATHSAMVLSIDGFVAEALQRLNEVNPLVDESTPVELAAQYWQWYGRVGMDGRRAVADCVNALDQAQQMFHDLGNARHEHACFRMKAQALIEIDQCSEAREAIECAMSLETAALPLADKMRRMRVQGLVEERSGNYQQASEIWAQALALAKAGKIERYELILLADIAGTQLKLGNAKEAVQKYTSLARRAQLGHVGGLTLSYALSGLVAAHLANNQLELARWAANRAVPVLRRSGLFLSRADVMALLLAREQKVAESAMLIGAADASRELTGSQRDTSECAIREEVLMLLAGQISEDQVKMAMKEGSMLSEDELVALIGLRTTHSSTS